MNKLTNRLIKLIFTLTLVIITTVPVFAIPYVNLQLSYDGEIHHYNSRKVTLYINYEEITELPLEPIILNNYTLVPAREVFENMNAVVNWLPDTSEIEVLYEDSILLMQINNIKASVNGEVSDMDIPPKLINGKTMIPVRFVSETMGFEVIWEDSTRSIHINRPFKEDELFEPQVPPTQNEDNKDETESEPEVDTPSTDEDLEDLEDPENLEDDEELQPDDGDCDDCLDETLQLLNIISIEIAESDENTFHIYADDEIEDFETSVMEDGSLIVDFPNSNNTMTETKFTTYMNWVSEIEVMSLGEDTTRFIFKAISPTSHNVFLSEDEKMLYVNFSGNKIKNIEATTENNIDTISILTEYTPQILDSYSDSSNSLILEFKNSNASLIVDRIDVDEDLMLVKSLEYASNDVGSTVFEFTFADNVLYVVEIKETLTILRIYDENTDPNDLHFEEEDNEVEEELEVVPSDRFVIENKSGISVNLDNIIHIDNYLDYQYILTFDQDISSILTPQSYSSSSEFVKDISVNVVNGKTQITINTNKITAVTVMQDSSNIYVNFVAPQQKYDYVIVVDPGHGAEAPGTVGNGLIEKELTLDTSLRLKGLLDTHDNIKVYYTRLTDTNPSFDFRTDMSNEVADFFISIHYNAAETTSANGSETFHLIANEHEESGLTSEVLANAIQNQLLSKLGTMNRGVKTANFVVLRNNIKPSILLEVGFVSNVAEAARMSEPSFRQSAAEAIYQACLEIIELYPNNR